MVDSYTLWNGDSEVFWERTSRSQNRGEWIRPTTPPPPVQINKGQVPMLCLESHPSIWPKVWTNEISCLLWLWPGLLPWEAGLIWIQSAEENREGIVSLYKITAVLCFHRIWNSENIKKKKKIHKRTFLIKLYFPTTLKGNRPSAPSTMPYFQGTDHRFFLTCSRYLCCRYWDECAVKGLRV